MRYFIGLIVIIIVFVIGIALLFGGHKKSPSTTKIVKTLPEYASTDATVSFAVDGTITGDDRHRQIKITVGRDERQLEVIQGYSGKVITRRSQYNTEAAYSVFLKALYGSGFTITRKGADLTADYSAICPLQNRYTLSLNQGGQTLSRLWTSDCGTNTGDFGGVFDQVQTLFQEQITSYDDVTGQVELNP